MLHLAAQPLGRATAQLARATLAAPPGGVTRSAAGLPAESSPGAPQDREAAGSPGPGAPPSGWDKDLTPSRAVAPRVDSPENPTPAAVPAAGDLVLSPVSKIRMARGMPSTVASHPGPQLKVLGNRDIGAVVASIAARRAKQA